MLYKWVKPFYIYLFFFWHQRVYIVYRTARKFAHPTIYYTPKLSKYIMLYNFYVHILDQEEKKRGKYQCVCVCVTLCIRFCFNVCKEKPYRSYSYKHIYKKNIYVYTEKYKT